MNETGLASGRLRGALILLTFLGLVVRIPGLDGDLWIDEIANLESSMRRPLLEIVSTYQSANQHVLYSILAHLCISLLGESSIALRLPALVMGVATVPAMYFLARSVAVQREALAATFLIAVSYHHAYFSQSARGYAGLLLFTVLSTAFLINAMRSAKVSCWIGFVATSVANLYSLLHGTFVLAAQVIGVFAACVVGTRGNHQSKGVLRAFLLSLTAIGVLTVALYAPMLGSMFTFFTTADRDVGWRPSVELLCATLQAASPHPVAGAVLLAGLPIGVAGLASIGRACVLFPFVMLLPTLIGLAVVTAMEVGTYPRFFLLVLPFAIIVAARGVTIAARTIASLFSPAEGHEGWLRSSFFLLLAIIALGAAAGLPKLYRLPKQDYTGALRFVQEHRSPDDLLAAAYIADTGARFYDPSVLSARTHSQLRALLERGKPIWLLGTFVADMRKREPALALLIDEQFREVWRFPGLAGDGDIVIWRSIDPVGPSLDGPGSSQVPGVRRATTL